MSYDFVIACRRRLLEGGTRDDVDAIFPLLEEAGAAIVVVDDHKVTATP